MTNLTDMPSLLVAPPHLVQAKQAAIAEGLDSKVVDSVLGWATQFYHEPLEHESMTLESLAALGTLYKYRDADDSRHWEMLEKQEVWFPLPTTFNDPFDANIGMRFDLLPEERLIALAERKIREEQPGAGYFLRKKAINDFLKWVHDPVTHDKAMATWIQRLTSKMRVFCVCPDRGNILLWSHYSRNHTGFAVGFETSKLHQLWQNNHGFQMGHVAYKANYPIMLPPTNEDKEAKANMITTIMNVKSSIWAYEREIRLTMFDGPQKSSFDPDLIKEIALGCRISPNNKERMLKLVDETYPHASVYQAKLSRDTFSLDFDKLRG